MNQPDPAEIENPDDPTLQRSKTPRAKAKRARWDLHREQLADRMMTQLATSQFGLAGAQLPYAGAQLPYGRPLSPLEVAIRDPSVPIERVVELAENAAGGATGEGS